MIAFRIPAHEEAPADGGGVWVPVDDVEATAAAVARVTSDPAPWRAAAAAAGDTGRARFTMDRFAEEFEALYEALLTRPCREFGWLRASRWPSAYTQWSRGRLGQRVGVGPRSADDLA